MSSTTPAPSPAPAPAPTPTTTSAPAPSPSGGDGGHSFTVPQEVNDWGKAKGYNMETLTKAMTDNPDIYKMATSYRDTEKYLGNDKLPIPKDSGDKAAWDNVYNKLGRPQEAGQYKIEVGDQADKTFVTEAQNAFHVAGLNQQQADALQSFWKSESQRIASAQLADTQAKAAADATALEKDWGGEFKAKQEMATRAWTQVSKDLGIAPEALDGLEKAVGLRNTMRLMEYIANVAKLGSDQFEGGGAFDRLRGQSIGPEQAQVKKDALMSDRAWYNRYRSGDATAAAQLRDLNNAIASGKRS